MNSEDREKLFEHVRQGLIAWRDQCEAEATKSQEYFQRFADALESEDLTGVLIRGHLYVENEMNNLLGAVLPWFEKADIIDFEFDGKLKILYAMGLISLQQRSAIRKLNKLRNETAHVATPRVIPLVTPNMVNQLWDSLGVELQSLFQGTYSRTENTASNLRQIIMDIMIMVHIIAEVAVDDIGVRDIVRYNATGETVQQRIEAAHKASENDPEPLASIKASIRSLTYEDRDNLRTWITEVYHY